MLQSLARGDFHILCPDNDVTRQTDEFSMQWAIDDITKNRPAPSRWRAMRRCLLNNGSVHYQSRAAAVRIWDRVSAAACLDTFIENIPPQAPLTRLMVVVMIVR
jgi:hypothetical protein